MIIVNGFQLKEPIMKPRGESRTAATSKMERFVIIVNGFQPLTIITKHSILDVAAALDPQLGKDGNIRGANLVVVPKSGSRSTCYRPIKKLILRLITNQKKWQIKRKMKSTRISS